MRIFVSPPPTPKEFKILLTPIKKSPKGLNTGANSPDSELGGTQAHSMGARRGPQREFTVVVTPMKPRQAQPIETLLDAQHLKDDGGRRFNVDLVELANGSEDSENFHDVEDGWDKLIEPQGKELVHKKISNLMEGIDLLLEKEINDPQYSSDEDQKQLAMEIQRLGKKYQACQCKSRKVELSEGVGFHTVQDSQATPSRSTMKKSKSSP